MILATDFGMFSIRAARRDETDPESPADPERLVVTAIHPEIVKLRALAPHLAKYHIESAPAADHSQLVLRKNDWVNLMAKLAAGVTYADFPEAAKSRGGKAHSACLGTLLELVSEARRLTLTLSHR